MHILASLKMMEVRLGRKKIISELATTFKIYPQVLKNVCITDKKAAQADTFVQNIVAKVADVLGDAGRILSENRVQNRWYVLGKKHQIMISVRNWWMKLLTYLVAEDIKSKESYNDSGTTEVVSDIRNMKETANVICISFAKLED